jgi:hypothetical protein
MRIKEGGRKAVVLILWAWEKGFPQIFKYSSVASTRTRLGSCAGKGLKWLKEESPL